MDILGRNTDNVHVGNVLIEGDLTVDGDIQKVGPTPPGPPTGVFNPLQELLDANNYRISNLGTATQLNDAISLSQANQTYLARTGGSMTGNIFMGGNLISDVGNAISNNDAVNKQYVDDNTIAKPIDENLNMNSFKITNVAAPVDTSDAVNKSYFDNNAVQNPLASNLSCGTFEINEITSLRAKPGSPLQIKLNPTSILSITGNYVTMGLQRILNLGTPLLDTDAATKSYVDNLVGNPGKLKYINNISDLPTPLFIDGETRYFIPTGTTWYFTEDITLEYGFNMVNKTEIQGNQNVTITFDESTRNITGFYSRTGNITIANITIFNGGGHDTGFGDPTNTSKGLFDCIDTLKAYRFRLLNTNIISPRRLGQVRGYGTLNINNNFMNGGGAFNNWYNVVVSTANNFVDGYPYTFVGSGNDVLLKAITNGSGTLTGVNMYSRGNNVVVPATITVDDDNGYDTKGQYLQNPSVPGALWGAYSSLNDTHFFVGYPDTTLGRNYVDIYEKQGDGTYSFLQAPFDGSGSSSLSIASVCSETGLLYYRHEDQLGTFIEISAFQLGANPSFPTNYTFIGKVGASASLNRFAESLACYTDTATSNRYVLVGEPVAAVGNSNCYLYVQPGGVGAFQLDFTYTGINVSDFGTSLSITKDLVCINNLGNKSVSIYPDFINTEIVIKPTDRKSYGTWGEVVDISYNSTFNEVRIAIAEPDRLSGITSGGTVYNIITGGVYIYYYDVATQTIKENKTQIIEYPESLTNAIISGLSFAMGSSLEFNKNDNADTLIVGAPLYNTGQGCILIYKFKTSNNSENGQFFLGQILFGSGLDSYGETVKGSNDNFLVYDQNLSFGRVNILKQGENKATGSININLVSNEQLGRLTMSGLEIQDGLSLEFNNNKVVLFAGARDPFADGSLLYFSEPQLTGINAVTISGNIFHPRNLETGININKNNITQLATISSNTFIRTGGVAPLIKYQDSDTINTYNHPSVQKFEISSNAGIIDSTPLLRNIYGLSDDISSATWTNIIYTNPEVNGIFDSSKRFALECRLDTTTDPQIGDYIRQTPAGQPSRKALIVGKEEKVNGNYQIIYLTDFTDVFYNDINVDIIDVDNNLISTATNFYLGDTIAQPSYIYVYIDKDPLDMKVSAVLSYTDDGKDKTKAFRINFADDGINYLNDDSLVIYHVNAKQDPDRTSVTILDSFTFKFGSKFKIETQYIDSTIYRIIEGIVSAK